MTDRVRVEGIIVQLENLWSCFDALFDSFDTEDWQRKHGADWTLADVPYHLAYFDNEIIAYPLACGPGLPAADRIELDSIAVLQRWNASQFARRSAYNEPDKAVARWRTTRAEMVEHLRTLTDADLDGTTWMALTLSRGWRTAEYVCRLCLAHGWNELMQLLYHAGRETPEPASDVTHMAVGEYLHLFQALLDPQAARDAPFSMVWDITGSGGGQWTAHTVDGKAQLSEGADPDADLVLRMSPLTFSLLWNGKLDRSEAVTSGQIGVSNVNALATFEMLFPPPDPNGPLPVVF